jgi:Flp pilus assembly protein TadG
MTPLPVRQPARRRRGIILMLSAFLMVFLLGVIAFAVDIGYIAHVRTDLQRATDAAAFAGAGALINGTSAAETEAVSYLGQNKVGGSTLGASNATVQFGTWSTTARTFTVNSNSPNAIRVSATATQQPFFFGKVFGKSDFAMTGQSVATYQPRDIALVLDYSGSMCYDSQFRSINLLGQSAIEANLFQIYQELGSPVYGNLTFTPQNWGGSSTTTTSIKAHFGLTNVAYPYPDGSWNEYISYVKTDSYINAAGYRYDYGYMTWLNYVMAKEGSAADGPGFHVASQQPVTALKDAVDVFLSYLQAHSTDDQVSVSIYTASDGTGKLENTLTKVYSTISNIVRNRQAGHYTSGTNISAGMSKGRVDLQNNARPGAKKIMILMTDGVVNLPSGNTTSDKAAVITQANACASAGIPIVTIALGAYADTALMQQVADITGGACFIVPGGQPIAQVQQQLEQVFVQVASDRPLRLVQ